MHFHPLEIGFPQGANLACLEFIIFINDITSAIAKCETNLFADNSTLSYACENLDKGIQTVNEDLDGLYDWICANKLALNVTKTKALILSRGASGQPDYKKIYEKGIKVNGEHIEIVTSIQLLGCVIDRRLKFNEHAEYMQSKMIKKVPYNEALR